MVYIPIVQDIIFHHLIAFIFIQWQHNVFIDKIVRGKNIILLIYDLIWIVKKYHQQ